MKMVEAAPLVHGFGDALEDFGEGLDLLDVGVVVGAGAGAFWTGVAEGLGAGIGNVFRLGGAGFVEVIELLRELEDASDGGLRDGNSGAGRLRWSSRGFGVASDSCD